MSDQVVSVRAANLVVSLHPNPDRWHVIQVQAFESGTCSRFPIEWDSSDAAGHSPPVLVAGKSCANADVEKTPRNFMFPPRLAQRLFH